MNSMSTLRRDIWQISSLVGSASYAETFIEYGVALVGPGDSGPWNETRNAGEFGGLAVQRFAREVKEGDVLLLRTASKTIVAVGLVASGYLYLDQFDDVYGRDLQHSRRVRWYSLPEDYTFPEEVFGSRPTAFSIANSPEIRRYADQFLGSFPNTWQTAPLPKLPEEEMAITNAPDHLADVIAQVVDLVPLYQDPIRFGNIPTEDELVGHFVIPFLKALGWQPELIGIKWRYVDLALFKNLPRTPENCQLIIEAKRLGTGVEAALEQGQRYLQDLGIRRDVVVTDGVRYRLYAHEHDFEGIAYANLNRLKKPALDLFTRLGRR